MHHQILFDVGFSETVRSALLGRLTLSPLPTIKIAPQNNAVHLRGYTCVGAGLARMYRPR